MGNLPGSEPIPQTSMLEVLQKEDRSLRKLVLLLAELSLSIAAQIPKSLGGTDQYNVYGEKQAEIDVRTNDLVTKKLAKSHLVRQVASEETPRATKFQTRRVLRNARSPGWFLKYNKQQSDGNYSRYLPRDQSSSEG